MSNVIEFKKYKGFLSIIFTNEKQRNCLSPQMMNLFKSIIDKELCNECRFDRKSTNDWVIEGPTKVSHQSVISQNHYLDDTRIRKLRLLGETELANGQHLKSPLGIGSLNPNNV